jgi:hypothetical protein
MTSRVVLLFFILVASVSLNISFTSATELDKDETSIYIGTASKSIYKGKKIYRSAKNGYFWNKWDMQTKIFILEGMDNGEFLLFLTVSEAKNSANAQQAVIESILSLETTGDFKLSDKVEQIDMFYKDSANRYIPIIEAYRYMVKRMNGTAQRELDNLAASLRKKYNKNN